MSARDEAVYLLAHYVMLLMERTGRPGDSDTFAEIEQIVDAIIKAAREPANTGKIEP